MDEVGRAIIGYGSISLIVVGCIWTVMFFAMERNWKVPTLVILGSLAITSLLYGVSFLVEFWVVNG